MDRMNVFLMRPTWDNINVKQNHIINFISVLLRCVCAKQKKKKKKNPIKLLFVSRIVGRASFFLLLLFASAIWQLMSYRAAANSQQHKFVFD